MHQGLATQNGIVNQFNTYMAQTDSYVPFRTNQLINQNVHVLNNLNNMVQQHRMLQNNMPIYQQQILAAQNLNNNGLNSQSINTNNPSGRNKQQLPKSTKNIIEDMLKPQKIVKNNKDVESSYKHRKMIQEKAKEKDGIGIEITNMPYKSIIKDKIPKKNVKDIREEDLIVHKSIRKIDADRDVFNKELAVKENEKEKINEELKIEFHIDNYDRHKKNFSYKESFIRNLAYEENTFSENKEDVIEFYRKKQKEAEDGKKLCDQILHDIQDDSVISRDELPTDSNENLVNDITSIPIVEESSINKQPTKIIDSDKSNPTKSNKNIIPKNIVNVKSNPKISIRRSITESKKLINPNQPSIKSNPTLNKPTIKK